MSRVLDLWRRTSFVYRMDICVAVLIVAFAAQAIASANLADALIYGCLLGASGYCVVRDRPK